MNARITILFYCVATCLAVLEQSGRGEVKILDEKEVVGPVPSDFDATLLRIAESVEKKESAARPEVAGLVQRVKALLAREAKPWPKEDDKMDKRMKLLGVLRLPSGGFNFQASIGGDSGFVFNATTDAMEGEILELQARMESGEDALTLLRRMGYLAGQIGDEARGRDYNRKTTKMARQRMEDNPGNADAHALLADVLDWGNETRRETESEARRALELDPKCWRAMLVLANGLSSHAEHELLPEGAPLLGEPHVEAMQLYRRLYDHPPDDARVAAMEKTFGEAAKLLDEAMKAAPGVIELKLRAAGITFEIFSLAIVKLLREQRPGSYDEFNVMLHQLQSVIGKKSFGDSFKRAFGDDLMTVVKLAPSNGHLLSAVAILAGLNHFLFEDKNWDDLPPATRRFVKDADSHLRKLGGSRDHAAAAKAWEGDAALQISYGAMGGPHGHLFEAAARAVALDPLRITAWDLLLLVLSENDKLSAMLAAAEIRLAVLPTEGSHLQCAAADKSAGDYAACLAHLEAVLEKKPEDFETLVWMAGVRLRQSQSKETLSAAEVSFDHIRDLYAAQRDSLKGEVVEDLLVNYAVFLALNGEEDRAVTIVQSGLGDGRLREEPGTKLLKILRP